MRRSLRFGVISLMFLSFMVDAANPIPVMILDGESAGNYHQWRLVTPVLKKQLEETGLFTVDVVTAPPAGSDFSAFKPDFAKYQVVVFNYDAPDARWTDDLKAAFEKYVQAGGGFVSVHAADNAFPNWTAFNEMIGIGGWRNRTEKNGPLWYYKDGKLVSDNTPGRAGSHGRRTPFQINVRGDHPITNGLPKTWMHQGDELYATLRGPGKNMSVLATAFSVATSNVPFLAIAQSRNRLVPGELALPLLIGFVAYALVLWGHRFVSGGVSII